MPNPMLYRIKVEPPLGEPYWVKCRTAEFTVGSAPDKDLVLMGTGIFPYHLYVKFADRVKVRDVDVRDLHDWPQYPGSRIYVPLLVGDYRLSLEEDPQTKRLLKTAEQPRQFDQPENAITHRLQNQKLRRILFFGTLVLLLGGFWSLFQTDTTHPVIAQKLLPTDTATVLATATLTPTPQPTATETPKPRLPRVAVILPPTPTLTPTPTATATPYPDTRETIYSLTPALQAYGGWVEAANVPIGQPYWKLVAVEWLVGDDAQGKSNIFVDVRNRNDQRDTTQQVALLDMSNQAQVTKATNDKPDSDYACDFPMFNAGPSYGIKVMGAMPSEIIHGLGRGRADDPTVMTSFKLIFQETYRNR